MLDAHVECFGKLIGARISLRNMTALAYVATLSYTCLR